MGGTEPVFQGVLEESPEGAGTTQPVPSLPEGEVISPSNKATDKKNILLRNMK